MARITNLQELLAEKNRLQAELELQKAIIETDVQRIKSKFDPIRKVAAFFSGKDNSGSAPPVLKAGANLGIEMLGLKLLKRAGWITRFVVPLVAKRISSTILDKIRKKKRPAYTINNDEYVPQYGERSVQ
jgi:hypothetical protein